MVLLGSNFSGCFLGSRGTVSERASKQMAEREPASISTIPLSTQSPQKDQDKAVIRENLPTPRNAYSQCNECFRQQHPFPFPQNCSLPIRHLGSWNGPPSTKFRTTSDDKGHELLGTATSLLMASGRAGTPPTPTNAREKKKKNSGAESRN